MNAFKAANFSRIAFSKIEAFFSNKLLFLEKWTSFIGAAVSHAVAIA